MLRSRGSGFGNDSIDHNASHLSVAPTTKANVDEQFQGHFSRNQYLAARLELRVIIHK